MDYRLITEVRAIPKITSAENAVCSGVLGLCVSVRQDSVFVAVCK